MLSTLILSERSYSAMHLAVQPKHHWFVQPGPLVLGLGLLKFPARTDEKTLQSNEQPNPGQEVLAM